MGAGSAGSKTVMGLINEVGGIREAIEDHLGRVRKVSSCRENKEDQLGG